MNEKENKYLSLKTAAELYGYTRDHLGLMIRQGKLKGIKLGSYYVTTSDWITDYLKRYANQNHPTTAGKFSNKFLTQAFAARSNTNKEENKTSQVKFSSKFENNYFSEIQKELLPSLQELSNAQEKTDVLPSASAQRYTTIDDQYVILPIRKMKELERESILLKISDHNGSENNPETV